MLAGEAGEPHPIHGDRVNVHLSGGRLTLSGELDSKEDRDGLVEEARQRIGNGLEDVDARHLRIAARPYAHGILDQTLVAAFPEAEVADLVRKLIIQRARVKPRVSEVVHAGQVEKLRQLLPDDFLRDAQGALAKNKALLVMTVDETDAFDVRRLLEEDTRSTWTVALPPQLSA